MSLVEVEPLYILVDPVALKKRRLESGFSQGELGERAGVSASAISALERGQGTARGRTIRLLAEALGCSPQDFTQVAARGDRLT